MVGRGRTHTKHSFLLLVSIHSLRKQTVNVYLCLPITEFSPDNHGTRSTAVYLDPSHYYIQEIIGMEGDTITYSDHKVFPDLSTVIISRVWEARTSREYLILRAIENHSCDLLSWDISKLGSIDWWISIFRLLQELIGMRSLLGICTYSLWLIIEKIKCVDLILTDVKWKLRGHNLEFGVLNRKV